MTEYVRLKNTFLNDKREVIGRYTSKHGTEYVWLVGVGGTPSTWYADVTEPWVPESAVGQVWRSIKSSLSGTVTVRTAENGWVGYTYNDSNGDSLGSCRSVARFTERYVYVSGPDA